MIVALCILAYLIIGWIVASACLTISMRHNNKAEISSDFALPFCLWPFVIIASVILLAIKIVMWLGHTTEKVILNLTKGDNK